MNEMVVKYYITDEQMQMIKDLKALCDRLGIIKSDSIGDFFGFMMQVGSAPDIDCRIAKMNDMALKIKCRRMEGGQEDERVDHNEDAGGRGGGDPHLHGVDAEQHH